MCKETKTLFTTINSANNKFEVAIEKPIDVEVNVFCNFNVFAYKGFITALENLQFLNLRKIYENEDGTSGFRIEFIQDSSLLQLIEHLPGLINQHVEMANPVSTIHKGTK